MNIDIVIKELSENFRLALKAEQYELAKAINAKINQCIQYYTNIKA